MKSKPNEYFYSHVNYSVTKINGDIQPRRHNFYSHVNYSVTKIGESFKYVAPFFYSHVNYSVTKIGTACHGLTASFTVT